jgi:predicted O-methyltransferase YrrM
MQDLRLIHRPAALAEIQRRTVEVQFNMAGEERTGSLLRALVASKPGGRILEIGTGTGVSTAWLLEGLDLTGSLVTVDVDEAVQRVARDELGSDPRIEFVLEDGVDYVQRQQPASFDLVFADAMAGKYDGLESALSVVKPGGFYVIDDMLPQANWPEGHATRVEDLLKRLSQLDDFRIVPMMWATGVVVAVRWSGFKGFDEWNSKEDDEDFSEL